MWGGREIWKDIFWCASLQPPCPFNKNQTPSACTESMRFLEATWNTRLLLHLFSCPHAGGMGEATCFYKRLASMLAQKFGGWGVAWPFPSSVQLSKPYEEQDPLEAKPPTPQTLPSLRPIYCTRFLISLSHPSFPFVLYIQYHLLYIFLFLFRCITWSACVWKKKKHNLLQHVTSVLQLLRTKSKLCTAVMRPRNDMLCGEINFVMHYWSY